MGRIGEAFGRELGPIIRYRSRVTKIEQDEHGVTAYYEDTAKPGTTLKARADWCLCTIPLSILSQIPMNVGKPMADAIAAVPYAAAIKIGLQFKRRFWEEDERDLRRHHDDGSADPADRLSVARLLRTRQGRAARRLYAGARDAFEFTAMSPGRARARRRALRQPDPSAVPQEFENGVAVAWHRSPFTMGCFGIWSEATREKHYNNLCDDRRPHRARRRACVVPAGVAGRRGHLGARCDRPDPSARGRGRTRMKTQSNSHHARCDRARYRRLVGICRTTCVLRAEEAAIRCSRPTRSRKRAVRRSTGTSARPATCPTAAARKAPARIRRSPENPHLASAQFTAATVCFGRNNMPHFGRAA